jgi:farnesyl-diphosphate farnesyltransferase
MCYLFAFFGVALVHKDVLEMMGHEHNSEHRRSWAAGLAGAAMQLAIFGGPFLALAIARGRTWLPALVVLAGLVIAAIGMAASSLSAARRLRATQILKGSAAVVALAALIGQQPSNVGRLLVVLLVPTVLASTVEHCGANSAGDGEHPIGLAAGSCFAGASFALLCLHRGWLWYASGRKIANSMVPASIGSGEPGLLSAACWSASGVLAFAVARRMFKQSSAGKSRRVRAGIALSALLAIAAVCAGGLAERVGALAAAAGAAGGLSPALAHPLGLSIGIGGVFVFGAATVAYDVLRRSGPRAAVEAIAVQRAEGGVRPPPRGWAAIRAAAREHVARPESFAILIPYLCVTWTLRLMPDSYYSFDGGVRPALVFLQVIVWDAAATVVHLALHRVRPLWRAAHSHHHRHRNPSLLQAYSGHVLDTCLLILLPLYTAATVVHANLWSYAAFGSLFSSYLLLIHSEVEHRWDCVLRALGCVTPKEHHVHHVVMPSNFSHFFIAWDRVLGTYRRPETVARMACCPQPPHRAAGACGGARTRGNVSRPPAADERDAEAVANASPIDAARKQGAYGKVKIHRAGKWATALRLLGRPGELAAVVRYKLGGGLPGVVRGALPTPEGYDPARGRGASKAASRRSEAAVAVDAGARSEDAAEGAVEDASLRDIVYCGEMLDRVSRSFAAVIRQLPRELALPVCVFYLVLRALDTLEDDMDLEKFRRVARRIRALHGCDRGPWADDAERSRSAGFRALLSEAGCALSPGAPVPDEAAIALKKCLLRRFAAWLSDDGAIPAECIAGVGEADEAALLSRFAPVQRVFRSLPGTHREIVRSVAERMGDGMADYIGRDLGQGCDDRSDYDRYCRIVAGLVGEGLSRQFAACGLEEKGVSAALRADVERGADSLSNHMGLFLQKTNIVRDYLEDYVDGRAFWPKTVWERHAPEPHLGSFALEENRPAAVACLNDLIADALQHAEKSVEYLSMLGDPGVLRFCAIPQLMAAATLAELWGNPKVFTGVVKIPRSLSAKIIMGCCGRRDFIWENFSESLCVIRNKMCFETGSVAERARTAIIRAEAVIRTRGK